MHSPAGVESICRSFAAGGGKNHAFGLAAPGSARNGGARLLVESIWLRADH